MHRNKPTLPRRHGTLTRRTLLCAAPGVAALGVTTWTGAATGPGISATEILIGQTLTLQGGRNAYGVEVQAGVRAAVEAANRSGGVNGRRIEMVTIDDAHLDHAWPYFSHMVSGFRAARGWSRDIPDGIVSAQPTRHFHRGQRHFLGRRLSRPCAARREHSRRLGI